MAFSASIFHVSYVIAVVLLATTVSAFVAGVTNATAATNTTVMVRRDGRSSAVSTTPADSDQYICYLCRGRNPLMIKWCPIDKDECHIACLSSPSTSSPRTLLVPAADGGRDDDDCYVMKLYPDGSWVIVDVVSCQASAGCYLVCSYGDKRRDGAGGTTPAAAARGPLPSRVADFERCGDQLIAPSAAVPGV